VGERVFHRVRAGKRGQQRWVDVQNPARKALEERRRQQLHVAGEDDELDASLCEPLRQLLVAALPRVELDCWEGARFDPGLRGPSSAFAFVLFEATATTGKSASSSACRFVPAPLTRTPITGSRRSRAPRGLIRGHDRTEADPEVEDVSQLRLVHMPREPVEDSRPLPSLPIDRSLAPFGEHPREVADYAAAGDVSERVYISAADELLYKHLVEHCRRQQIRTVIGLVLEHTPDEGEAVRVRARGLPADHDVAGLHFRAVHRGLAINDAYARSGEVQLLFAIDAGQLGSLAPEQRAASFATDFGGSLDQLRDLVEIDRVRGDVVEQEERLRRRSSTRR
jgi:hypothetical protein